MPCDAKGWGKTSPLKIKENVISHLPNTLFSCSPSSFSKSNFSYSKGKLLKNKANKQNEYSNK